MLPNVKFRNAEIQNISLRDRNVKILQGLEEGNTSLIMIIVLQWNQDVI